MIFRFVSPLSHGHLHFLLLLFIFGSSGLDKGPGEDIDPLKEPLGCSNGLHCSEQRPACSLELGRGARRVAAGGVLPLQSIEKGCQILEIKKLMQEPNRGDNRETKGTLVRVSKHGT